MKEEGGWQGAALDNWIKWILMHHRMEVFKTKHKLPQLIKSETQLAASPGPCC